MAIDERLLLAPGTIWDFDLPLSRIPLDRRTSGLREMMLTMSTTTRRADLDTERLNDLAVLQTHRFGDSGVFMNIINDYFVGEFIRRLQNMEEFDDVLLFEDEVGTRRETANYEFQFKENEQSLHARHKREPNKSVTINSLVTVQKGRTRQALIVDVTFSKHLANHLGPTSVAHQASAARELLASFGIVPSALSHVLCLPERTITGVLRYDTHKDQNQIRQSTRLRNYMMEQGPNLLLAFSGCGNDYQQLAQWLQEKMTTPGAIGLLRSRAKINVEHWAKKHSELFPNLETAYPVLLAGYQRISGIHDAFVGLVHRDSELGEVRNSSSFKFREQDVHAVHKTNLALVYRARPATERTMLTMFMHIYRMLALLPSQSQAECLAALFDVFPTPNTNSFDDLVRSTYGTHVFPKQFAKHLRGFLSTRLSELCQEGKSGFDAQSFPQAVTAYVRDVTSHGRDKGQVLYTQGSRMPDSFESRTS